MSAAKAAVRTPLAIIDVLKQAKSWKVSSFFTSRSSARVDNFIFSLHSNVTVAILTLSMVFVGMKQYFGEPIECLNIATGPSSLTQAQMQHYCWMEGAFTIVTRYPSDDPRKLFEITGQDSAYPGVKDFKPHKGDMKMPHKYYQWVYYILCIQCLLFYAPKYVWRFREDGRLALLIEQIKSKHVLQYEGMDRYQIVQDTLDIMLIADEFFNWIIFSELLYLLHLIMEIWFINLFLGGKFLFLGFQWLHYTHHSDDIALDPLVRIFPRLTKCSFHKFGVSGSIETFDTLCFMPMNIVNEKIFVILWFWFMILLMATLYHLFVYRAAIILVPFYRFKRLVAIAPTADLRFLKKIAKRPGRWFVMHTIATNLKPYYFRDLLRQMQEDHFAKDLKLDSKITMKDFMVDGKVPQTSIPSAPKTAPPPAGWKDEVKDNQPSTSYDSGNDEQSSALVPQLDWPDESEEIKW